MSRDEDNLATLDRSALPIFNDATNETGRPVSLLSLIFPMLNIGGFDKG